MVFIYRGSGLMVPIIFFITAWLVSYSIDDPRLGNAHYMGWTLFWAGIPIFIAGGLIAASNGADPETGEKPEKTYSDLFFIPSWIWGLFFIIFGLYL